VCAVAVVAPAASAQWVTTYHQFYFPDRANWAFRNNYPAADRLFNAFDYGHAILYERLYTRPGADPSLLEQEEYDFITKKLLVSPPRLPLEESAIEVRYAKLAPEAKSMFDWAHVLHRQIYDIWADERIPVAEKDARIARLITYYKSRRDLAFSSVPKNMDLMEGQYYSRAFRDGYPKFNGLIWGYHWLQVGLYEPLIVGRNVDERQTGVIAAVARFKQMLENAPENMPRMMPMTAAIAPEFAKRYPEAAIIFDNLHAMHDVISDILASPKVPKSKKRHEIMLAADRYRDNTSFAMTRREWLEMSQMMGVANMGGPAVRFLPAFPTPTVARGASMDEAMKGGDHANMPGMGTAAAGRDSAAGADHSAHGATSGVATGASPMDLQMRLLRDPVIRRRLLADSTTRRMTLDMIGQMPADHRAEMMRLLADTASAPAPAAAPAAAQRAPARAAPRPAAARPAAPTPSKPAPKPAMDHSKHGAGTP
jgi:hypothetical protein